MRPWMPIILAALLSWSTAGCSCEEDELDRVRSGPRHAHPDAEGAIGRCRAAIDTMHELPIDTRLSSVVRACAELYAEPGCREAMTGLMAHRPDRRSVELARACREAYCLKLPVPRPELCTGAFPPRSITELEARWRAFNVAVFERDLGTSDPLEGAGFRYLETVSREGARPAAQEEVAPVRVSMQPSDGNEHTLMVSMLGGEVQRTSLPDGFGDAEVASVLRDELRIPITTPLVLAADAHLPYSALVQLMQGATAAGFDRFTLEGAE